MTKNRIANLEAYVRRLSAGEDGWKLYHAYKTEITSITPAETLELMNNRLLKGESVLTILDNLEKLMHVFSQSHKNYVIDKFEENSFLGTLQEENNALKQKLDAMRSIILKRDYAGNKVIYLDFMEMLKSFNTHYLKKENLLFPALEMKQNQFTGLKIMWALHDSIRTQIQDCVLCINADTMDFKSLDKQIGIVYFALYGCIEKEERILFPLALELLTNQEMNTLLEESFEYGFPLISAPLKPSPRSTESLPVGSFKTETGSLTNTELLAVFSALPVDLTFVDSNDKVRFFSKAKDRIFPRTSAILGRDVRNCHPPGSVHVVLDIIDTFRQGTQDSATFWIQMGDKFILIQYFALRDADRNYLGTLEVSQNVSEIRGLEGQRRILSWEAKK